MIEKNQVQAACDRFTAETKIVVSARAQNFLLELLQAITEEPHEGWRGAEQTDRSRATEDFQRSSAQILLAIVSDEAPPPELFRSYGPIPWPSYYPAWPTRHPLKEIRYFHVLIWISKWVGALNPFPCD
jgi:hypothetical protein